MAIHESDQLIRTKFRLPFTRPDLIPRPRLQEQVLRGLRGPLTLITAPAGFGKTTLLASCIAGCGMPAAWLSLDKDDNRAGRFLSYVVAALNSLDSRVGSESGQLLASSPQAPAEAVLTSLINDLDATGEELALVLDDYHAISSQTVHGAVAFLLEHQPQAFHLIIATRSDPQLPVTRLRARAQTVELRASDLRFTTAEAAAFLNDVMGLHLDSGSVAALEERTEGWIAGLQMAALSMRNHEDVAGFIEGFSGSQRYILDYLLEEILTVQSPEIQRFLLRTSVLERLSAPLCDAVLAGGEADESAQLAPCANLAPEGASSQGVLEYLERANLFLVPLDDERTWYRYHHLFGDLLRARVDQVYPGLLPRLHARAAAWLEQAGMTVEAVNHTVSAGDFDRAAHLVEVHTTRLLAQGELNALMAWIDILPVELRTTRPWLCVHQAYALLFAGRTTEVEPLLAQAEASSEIQRRHGTYASSTGAAGDGALRGAVLAARAFTAALLVGGPEAISQAEQARQLVASHDIFSQALLSWALGYALHGEGRLSEARLALEEQVRLSRTMRNNATLMIGVTALARLLADQGEFREARAVLEEALVEAQRASPQNLGFISRVQAHLAAILCEQNELADAHRLLTEALHHARFWRNANHLASIYVYLTRVLIAEGDFPAARTSIGEADQIRRTATLSAWLRRSLEGDIVDAWLSLPDAGRGIAVYDPLAEQANLILASWRTESGTGASSQDAGASRGAEWRGITLARIALAAGHPEQALRLLEPVTQSATASEHVDLAVHCLVLTAVALQAKRAGTGAALAALHDALALAQKGGYVRVFVREGEPMRMLLAQWLAHAATGPLQEYASALLAAFDAQSQAAAAAAQKAAPDAALVEPLSPRELEVLRLLALGKSNQEIAGQLVVAPGTVKAHAASIYRKLDAANRTEAVARARTLGILP